jgi:hypothetical protein
MIGFSCDTGLCLNNTVDYHEFMDMIACGGIMVGSDDVLPLMTENKET